MSAVRMIIRAALPQRSDVDVARADLLARLAGYCNAKSDTGDLDRRPGGYTHWRCDRRARHRGRHRGINYTWTAAAGSCVYDPVDTPAQRTAALASDTVDVRPLPAKRARPMRLSWSQRIRRVLWQLRTDARRRRSSTAGASS